MVTDSLCTVLGSRPNDRKRLWLEDAYGRLSRNGWSGGVNFDAKPKPGVGMVFSRAVLGPYEVSHRRGVSLFSFEGRKLVEAMPVPDVRVKIAVNLIAVMPRLRVFAVRRGVAAAWRLEGLSLVSEDGRSLRLDAARPVRPPRDIGSISVRLDEGNLVAATELLGDALPARVELSGDPLLVRVASRFLADGDYRETAPGLLERPC